MFSYEKYSEIRDRAGLTDAKVARGAGLRKQMISAWKNTEKVNPGVDSVAKIAAFLNVPMESLLESEKDDNVEEYLKNAEVLKIAEKVHEDENIKSLFNKTRDATKEDVQFILDVAERVIKE